MQMKDENDNTESTSTKLIKGGLRSIAASVPFAASLAQAWSEYEGHKQSERTDKFFRELREALSLHEARIRAVENHITTSGEFPDLIERAVTSAQRTNSDEKIKRLAQALASSLAAGNTVHYEDKLNLLDALDSLTEEDILLLSHFADGRIQHVDQIFQTTNLRGSNQEEKLGFLILSLSKLESRAIIGETSPETFRVVGGVGDPSAWFNRWRAKYYVLLPFGKLVVSALQSKL